MNSLSHSGIGDVRGWNLIKAFENSVLQEELNKEQKSKAKDAYNEKDL
jgi:hypothetical protein